MLNPGPAVAVLVPGLFESFHGIDAGFFPPLKALTALLSKGSSVKTPDYGYESCLCRLFGVQPDIRGELPVAQLSWLADHGVACESSLLRADPVYLRPDHSELRLYGADQLAIQQEESGALISLLNNTYRKQGYEFIATSPDCWYLKTARQVSVVTQPLSIMLGQNIRGRLPVGEGSGDWPGLFNEIQMLFHDQPVNQKRKDEQRPVVNSVWFWGCASLPDSKDIDSLYVMSNERVGKGLAKYTGVDHGQLPGSLRDVAAGFTGYNKLIIVLDDLLEPSAYDDFSLWSERLSTLETKWFGPLQALLRRNRISQLRITGCSGIDYLVRAGDMLRFWKPVRHFSGFSVKN